RRHGRLAPANQSGVYSSVGPHDLFRLCLLSLGGASCNSVVSIRGARESSGLCERRLSSGADSADAAYVALADLCSADRLLSFLYLGRPPQIRKPGPRLN